MTGPTGRPKLPARARTRNRDAKLERPDGDRINRQVDINDLKRAEREAEAARDYAESILRTVRTPLVVLRADLRVDTANEAFYKTFRTAPDEIIGHSIFNLPCGAWDIPELRTLIGDVLPRSSFFSDFEVTRDFPRIGRRTMLLNARRLDQGVDSEQLILLGIEDMSERQRIDVAGAALAAIVNSSDDAIIGKDLNGIIRSWNNGAERLFGYTAQEAIGQPITMLIPFERLNEEPEILERLKRGERVDHFDTIRVRKDGLRVEISLTISPIRDSTGKIAGASKIARDITERKRAEQALRASEMRFRELANAMPQIVWAARPDGYIDYYNRRWYEYTGFAEGYGQESWEPILHSDDVRRCVETYFGCIRDGKPYQIEYRFKDRFRGGYRWFMGRAVPIRDERGEIVRWFGTCTDIDDVKQAQAALNEADRRRSEFMALLAHELRGPLAPLNHVLQLLKRAGDDVELVQQATGAMERQLDRLTRLVDDLLDVNRVSRGKLTLRREHIELASVLHNVVDSWRPMLADSKHELVLTLPSQPVYVYADSVRLVQLFGNLLSNASKYSEPGSRIELTVEQQGGEALVSVKDTGIGIPPDMLSKIFEIFTQVDQSLERSQGGLGIGLMLVKQLVEMHGGSVRALSEGPGRGSEFVVRLPVQTGKPRQEQPLKTIRAGPTSTEGHRILVVDDNRDSAGSLAALLQMTGNETHMAYDGLQALDEAATFKPQVVLLDIGLPELNGYDVCRKIRQQPWGKDMVLIALTGWGQEEDRKRSAEAGFDDHLVKPVNHDALMKILAEPRPR